MTKRIISILIASLMLITIIPLSTASAESKYFLCDVNNDSKITAADARLTLRYSVELETFADHQIFSADCAEPIGKITAADARLILRISVELDSVPVHACNFTRVKIKRAPTCSVEGIKEYFCDCGNSKTEIMATLEHKKIQTLPGKAATCSSSGLTEGLKCLDCESIIKAQQPTQQLDHNYKWTIIKEATPISLGQKTGVCQNSGCNATLTTQYSDAHANHKLSRLTVTAEKGITCETCNKELIPSFNSLVNKLKDKSIDAKTYQVNIEKNSDFQVIPRNSNYKKLAESLFNMFTGDDPSLKASQTIAYSPLSIIKTTYKSFPVKNESFVSDLKDSDVNKISTSVVSLKYDLLKNLPNDGSVNLSAIKNSPTDEVIKISVEVIPENASLANPSTGNSPSKKIACTNLTPNYSSSGFDDLSDDLLDLGEFANYFSFDFLTQSTCTVDYYFTCDSLSPIAAKYNSTAISDALIYFYFNDNFEKEDSPTFTFKTTLTEAQENYFFFY